jgi:hypothetical protein
MPLRGCPLPHTTVCCCCVFEFRFKVQAPPQVVKQAEEVRAKAKKFKSFYILIQDVVVYTRIFHVLPVFEYIGNHPLFNFGAKLVCLL